MIEIGSGDLLAQDVDALVNPVNTVGVMGKGLALQFKRAYPDNFIAYRRACENGRVTPGRMFVHTRHATGPRRHVINFPTKQHWRAPSRLGYIRTGLDDLTATIQRLNIRSIAVPALGCGLGGLKWSVVEPRIRRAFEGLPEVRVVLFPPDRAR